MAKNFPYFKFVATEWLTGDIVFEDYELQGLFINVCALYWHRDGKINIEELTKRLKSDRVLELKDRFITLDEKGFINIKFLDEQLVDANHISKVNSENGKKGAEAKRNKATAKRPLSDSSAKSSKEEEEKEEEKELKEEVKEIIDYLNLICQTNFRYSKSSIKHINARLNDGFCIDEIKKVIYFKHKQWGQDVKMKEYLRPETLFGNKFESYLQSAKLGAQPQQVTKVVSKAKELL